MTIYLDLDETLIHAVPGRPGMGLGSRVVVNAGLKTNGRNDTYHTALRDSAHTLIQRCRAAAPTKILTTAAREYAIAQNQTFSFGFSEDDIIAREDFLEPTSTAYGGEDLLVKKVRQCPNALLIDNLPAHEPSAKRKMLFLGINPDRYIQIREFIGCKDPDKFRGELLGIFQRIERETTPKKPQQNLCPEMC